MLESAGLSNRKINFPRLVSFWPYVAAFFILIFAFYIRHHTFWLPHWQGDQSQYVALAMKLDKKGLEGYNLFEAEIHFLTLNEAADQKLAYPSLAPNGEKGDFYRAYEQVGLKSYNDLKLFYKSPFFPVTLMASHRLFTKPDHPYLVAVSNFGRNASKIRPRFFFEGQFWAVIVPLLSSLLLLVLVFFLGKKLFGVYAGLAAMFFMAIHPVDIITSQKLLADDLLACFFTGSLLVFYTAYHKKGYLGVIAAGILCGFAVLTKQNAGLLFFTIAAYILLTSYKGSQGLFRFLFNPFLICYVAGALFISAHWFWKIYKVYGNPFYEPTFESFLVTDLSGWFRMLSNRPPPLFLLFLYTPLLCPPLLFFYFSLKSLFSEIKVVFTKRMETLRLPVFFLWFCVLSFVSFFVLRGAREERYFLPVYPSLAVLSGVGLEKVRRRILPYFARPLYADIVFALFFIASAVWSVPIGLENTFNERFLIQAPLRDWLTYCGIFNA